MGRAGPPNLAMLTNVVEAVEPAAERLAHVSLMQGYKVYGAHLGPFETPARERRPAPHAARVQRRPAGVPRDTAVGAGWTWSALRPSVVIGFGLGNPMNLAVVIAVYATLCRELGVPLRFPGRPGAYDGRVEMTDAGLLALAATWAATNPAGGGEAFNVTNGDLIRWPARGR